MAVSIYRSFFKITIITTLLKFLLLRIKRFGDGVAFTWSRLIPAGRYQCSAAVRQGACDLQPGALRACALSIFLFIFCQLLMPTGGGPKGNKPSEDTLCSQVNTRDGKTTSAVQLQGAESESLREYYGSREMHFQLEEVWWQRKLKL